MPPLPKLMYEEIAAPPNGEGDEIDTMAEAGSDLKAGPFCVVTFAREGKPPLRFKGNRLTHHWLRLSGDSVIEVQLWQQGKQGLVLVYSALDQSAITTRVIQVFDLFEASDCLENVCANLDTNPKLSPQEACFWSDFHLKLCFRQQFARLISDVLTDWHVASHQQEVPQ